MNHAIRTIAFAAATACLAAGASAEILSSVDLAPIDGTRWADVMTTPVHLNFGYLGTGEVSFTSVNGGAGEVSRSDYGDLFARVGPTQLDNGALFAPTTEAIFLIDPSSNPGLSGFTMTVTLDHGTFAPGSVFSPRSLDANGAYVQGVLPGTGLGAPDTRQLPTDGNNIPDLALNATYGMYTASIDGRSKGLAFEIEGVNSFSATFVASAGYQPGGVAFTLAIPPAMTAAIPEPSTCALMFAGLGAICFKARRRSPK